MERNVGKIRSAGLGLAAISYDSVPVLQNFAQRQHITFPLLSDSDSKIIREFGILNEEVPKGTPTFGIPYPGIYILDASGKVTGKYFEANYRERDSAGLVLLKQFGIQPETPHTSQRAKHLGVTTSASATVVRQNLRIALIADVHLDENVHVYAPGVEGYIPISWTMAESPAWKSEAVEFPPSKKLRLEAIKETVPVFEKKFRLVRDVTIADEKTVRPLLDAAGNLTIEGSLRYQACDDRVCYIPETVPVKWTVRFEALERTRVPAELQKK